ncbi:DNAse [Pseudomonas sp. 1D4]|uniref:endonuclease/exonuclease/phosphatase family protein n=1 Tax=Pseudomonadaceae TaxID=135621 RepID=UPI00084B1B3B|nr:MULTISPECIES: endonuclease/exonuclease/phosphatase family protein [Pseudomonas]OEC37929.1 DNAse [Pseudomonas sp. 1D4]
MTGLFGIGLFFAAVLASTIVSAADLTIMSWNAKRLGQSNEQSVAALATVAGRADLLAVQEVMTEAGLTKLEAALEKQTGEQWSSLASHLLGSRSYKEIYAFLMRDSAVAYEDGAVVYMDRGDRFIREPFSARFKSKRDGSVFAAATVHILYGNGPQDREPEIQALATYWSWLEDAYSDTPVMLMGDFNTPPSDPAFRRLSQYAVPLITEGATTLSSRDGLYINLYDNIWVSSKTSFQLTSAGIMDYPRIIGWSNEKSRKHVSDHVPVFVTLGNAKLEQGAPVVHPEAARGKPQAKRTAQMFPIASKTETALSGRSVAGAGSVRANSSSRLYHRIECPSYENISPKNRIEFASGVEAEKAGYRLAGNCR